MHAHSISPRSEVPSSIKHLNNSFHHGTPDIHAQNKSVMIDPIHSEKRDHGFEAHNVYQNQDNTGFQGTNTFRS